ncbi:MAG TPA: hypothetical protein VNR18_01990 [Hyphomicrobiales bacterium]|nr:hypothetical protein [Hyphomicrobiales bacterium]
MSTALAITPKTLPGDTAHTKWVRREDLTLRQLVQVRTLFGGWASDNHLYLVDDAAGEVTDRRHLSAFSFSDLVSIDAL